MNILISKIRFHGASPLVIALAWGLLNPLTSSAQEKLKDVVNDSGFGWIAGQWKGESDNGDVVRLTYEWDLDGYVLKTRFKTPDTEALGMTVYAASKEKAIYSSADNQGNLGNGEWSDADGKAVLKYEGVNPYGEKQRMGFVHSKVDGDTMKVEIHGIEDGQLGEEVFMTLTFKRQ